MAWITIKNQSRPAPAVKARYCASFLCQLRGLTFRRQLPLEEGLLLVQKRNSRLDASIHMLFVAFDLAVVWINSEKEVVDVQVARRWRPAYVPRLPAQYVLELVAERQDDFQVGDRVQFEEE